MIQQTSNTYYVYLFQCADNTLYCGITNDLKKREQAHNQGKGSSYVRARGGGQIVYSEPHPTRSAALRREAEIKKFNRRQKEALLYK